jgi:hypothetical protein
LKLMQIDRAEVVARVSESYRGPERNLSQAVRFAARSLVGVSTQGRGDLAVLSEVGSARSKIDGDQLIQLPQRVRRLPAGKHTLATLADGYHPHFQEFYVEPDVTTNVRPDLIAMPSSWYDEWWVWTIIGAAVVGAVGTTVVIATDSPENGSVDVLVRR